MTNLWEWPTKLALGASIAQAHIEGIRPAPKERPRFVGINGKGQPIVKTAKATSDAETAFGWQVIADTPNLQLDDRHLLGVRFEFRFTDWRRVDSDNLSKLALDAMNGLVYADDSQVVELHTRILRGWELPGTDMLVYVVGDRPPLQPGRPRSRSVSRST